MLTVVYLMGLAALSYACLSRHVLDPIDVGLLSVTLILLPDLLTNMITHLAQVASNQSDS